MQTMNRQDARRVQSALDFAVKWHTGQTRKDGVTSYVEHVKRVSNNVGEEFPDDLNMRIAALLHDVIEDTEATYAQVYKSFGEDVAYLVDMLSKPDDKSHRHVRYMARLKNADARVKAIKRHDILDNLGDLDSADDDFVGFFLKRARSYVDTVYVNDPESQQQLRDAATAAESRRENLGK